MLKTAIDKLTHHCVRANDGTLMHSPVVCIHVHTSAVCTC